MTAVVVEFSGTFLRAHSIEYLILAWYVCKEESPNEAHHQHEEEESQLMKASGLRAVGSERPRILHSPVRDARRALLVTRFPLISCLLEESRAPGPGLSADNNVMHNTIYDAVDDPASEVCAPHPSVEEHGIFPYPARMPENRAILWTPGPGDPMSSCPYGDR